ncbi:unnamed protein product [Litomosoides sigmodontis]|uniref:Uncharacterized protein n=1 Tax=Litomosoides sigmodontis TaxID=42156 RepID=A0A3P6T141_LITSI|nr:unnamed protein product [Litomosoides sigmodontis]
MSCTNQYFSLAELCDNNHLSFRKFKFFINEMGWAINKIVRQLQFIVMTISGGALKWKSFQRLNFTLRGGLKWKKKWESEGARLPAPK